VMASTSSSGSPLVALFFAVVLIILNGLFVAAEFALLASRRSRVEPMLLSERLGARSALRSMGDIGPTLAATQLGVTIASLTLGAVAEPAVGGLFERLFGVMSIPERLSQVVSLVLALSIVVFAHLLVGEMIPKSLALTSPERTLVALAGPVRGFLFVLRPVIWILDQSARVGARLMGVTPTDELRTAHTSAEIGMMVEESREEGLLKDDQVVMLAGALAFVGRTVGQVMVPLSRIVTVGLDDSVLEVEEVVRSSGHSRVLVRGEQPGSIAGFVHVKGLLALGPELRSSALPAGSLRTTFSVTPGDGLGAVLVLMRQEQRHLAVVVDENRTMIGLVTSEDILESIVGDIADETDRPG